MKSRIGASLVEVVLIVQVVAISLVGLGTLFGENIRGLMSAQANCLAGDEQGNPSTRVASPADIRARRANSSFDAKAVHAALTLAQDPELQHGDWQAGPTMPLDARYLRKVATRAKGKIPASVTITRQVVADESGRARHRTLITEIAIPEQLTPVEFSEDQAYVTQVAPGMDVEYGLDLRTKPVRQSVRRQVDSPWFHVAPDKPFQAYFAQRGLSMGRSGRAGSSARGPRGGWRRLAHAQNHGPGFRRIHRGRSVFGLDQSRLGHCGRGVTPDQRTVITSQLANELPQSPEFALAVVIHNPTQVKQGERPFQLVIQNAGSQKDYLAFANERQGAAGSKCPVATDCKGTTACVSSDPLLSDYRECARNIATR